MTILSVQNLTKVFYVHALGGREIPGCVGVSFDVEPGRCLGLAGPSGSGKSSVLKCIYRTYLPTSGRILYRAADGGEIDLAQARQETVLALRRQEIGFVTQFLHVVPRVPALDVVAERLWNVGWEREEARRAAAEILGRLRIPRNLWEVSPATFSGGERQKVNLARALVLRPRLLLLDEPTASLDAASRAVVVALLREIKKQGTGMVAAFHDEETAQQLVDDTLPMEPAAQVAAPGG